MIVPMTTTLSTPSKLTKLRPTTRSICKFKNYVVCCVECVDFVLSVMCCLLLFVVVCCLLLFVGGVV